MSSKVFRRIMLWHGFLVLLAALPAIAEETPDDPATAIANADERFNRAAQQRDRETFRDLLAQDATFFAGEVHRGRLEVLSIWRHLFEGKYDFRYEAKTLETIAAESGEFGWSLGSVRTSFTRPGLDTPTVNQGHYLNLWRRKIGETNAWELAYSAPLVVHPVLGEARESRTALMAAWSDLADQIDAEISIDWTPRQSERAASGEVAWVFGEYKARFNHPAPAATSENDTDADPATASASVAPPLSGKGHYLALWRKEESGRWQLAAESFTPPSIYRPQDAP